MVHSLRKLLNYHRKDLGIVNILWLPSLNLYKRLVITFNSTLPPSLLLSRRSVLRKYWIFPTRVFVDNTCRPLCKLSDNHISTKGSNKNLPLGRDLISKCSAITSSPCKEHVSCSQSLERPRFKVSSTQKSSILPSSNENEPNVSDPGQPQSNINVDLSSGIQEARASSFTSMPSLESSSCLLDVANVTSPELSPTIPVDVGVIQSAPGIISESTSKEKLESTMLPSFRPNNQDDCDLNPRIFHNINFFPKSPRFYKAKSLATELAEATNLGLVLQSPQILVHQPHNRPDDDGSVVPVNSALDPPLNPRNDSVRPMTALPIPASPEIPN